MYARKQGYLVRAGWSLPDSVSVHARKRGYPLLDLLVWQEKPKIKLDFTLWKEIHRYEWFCTEGKPCNAYQLKR